MKRICFGLALSLISLGGAMAADDDAPFAKEVEARQGLMIYRALNLGVLGAMAKGETEYDAAKASKAAENLVAAGQLDMSMLWPEGSDAAGNPDSTAAAALWADGAGVGAKGAEYLTAALAMQTAAGSGIDALKAAMEPLGASCGGCHKAYRVPSN